MPESQALDAVYAKFGRVPVGGSPVLEELYGELLIAAIDPEIQPVLAEAISSDGLALKRPMLEGVGLDRILESQRLGTPLHHDYDIPDLLKQLVALQKKGQGLLFETGMTVDMLTPSNFLVQGKGVRGRLIHYDRGLVQPTAATRALYASWGIVIPEPLFPSLARTATVWPLFPSHILYSRVWGLNLEQSLEYARASRGLYDRRSPYAVIAEVPVLPIEMAPYLQDSRIINHCRLLLEGL